MPCVRAILMANVTEGRSHMTGADSFGIGSTLYIQNTISLSMLELIKRSTFLTWERG